MQMRTGAYLTFTENQKIKIYVRLEFVSFRKRHVLDSLKFKRSVDDNFKIGTMEHRLQFRIENFVGKGENAGNQHFLLFPQCFQKLSLPVDVSTQIFSVKGQKALEVYRDLRFA